MESLAALLVEAEGRQKHEERGQPDLQRSVAISSRAQKPCSVVPSARMGNDRSYCRVLGAGKATEKKNHKDANSEEEHEGQEGEVHDVQDEEVQADEDRRAK